ncbi:MAG: ABC-type transport auxiliary lipoprotein family protein [Gammaproteobacteria bacterium]|nr:ABC-type transport auxiliary lipoprotein family protein [Gammaproteobacteria bacterium]
MNPRTVCLLPLWLALAGCAPLLPTPETTETVARHAVRPDILPAPAPAVPGAPALAVAQLRRGPLIDDRAMVYVDAEGRRGTFVNNAWAAPPDLQLAEWLVAALERAGGTPAVVAPGGRGDAELLLEGELLRFELVAEPPPGSLRAELRLQLLTARGREVLATARLAESEPLAEPGPVAMGDAADRAVARLLDAGARFVRDAVVARVRETGRE